MASAQTSIRLIDVSDAGAIANHLARDAKESPYWGPARPDRFYTTPGQINRIAALLDLHRNGVGWPGVIVTDDAVIGQVTVSAILRGPFQKGFLGYWVASTHQNRGHASDAVELTLRVMTKELGLHRIEAHTRVDNLASQKVLRANGFTSWGIARGHIYINGAWHDEIFWERTLTNEAPTD